MRESQLLEILQAARSNNSLLHITGMLLYADGAVVQMLEGSAQAVEKLFRKIRRDPRHHRFLILLDRVTGQRDFDGLNMGFERTTQQELDQIGGFFEWTTEMPTHRKTASAIRLIESFRHSSVIH